MDIARPDQKRKKRIRRFITSVVALLLLTGISVAVSRLQPAAPAIEKGQVWSDTVKRGEMLRQVRGNGTLLPEQIVWIPTHNPGRVERILVFPGAPVTADTILVELSNPEVEQAAFDAEWQLKAAESEVTNLQVQLDTLRLNQQAVVATAEANHKSARLDFEVNEELAKAGLVPALTLKQSRTRADQLEQLLAIERERLKISADSARAQLAVQEAKVAQLRAQSQLRKQHVENLKIRAAIDGVLQKLGDASNLQIGQQLPAGANVARVANPARLKAEIRIAETQAKDVQYGQLVKVDTRNGIVDGRVVRIDPAVQNGTVTVEVALEGPMPRGARPDLSVDGTIELERLADVMHVGRPVHGQPDSTVGLFVITSGGREAVRVPVRLGRSSVSTIEVIDGLQVGDQVILSDMSAYDTHNRVRLN